MNEELVKAIFAAGVRCGYTQGIKDGKDYEFRQACNPKEVWENVVQPEIEATEFEPHDIFNIGHWEMIP